MFLLYAVVVGLVLGLLLGGTALRPRRRSSSAGRRWRSPGSPSRSLLFSGRRSATGSATSGRSSTSGRPRMVLVVVLRNLRMAGMPLVALGAASQPRRDRRQRRLHAGSPARRPPPAGPRR